MRSRSRTNVARKAVMQTASSVNGLNVQRSEKEYYQRTRNMRFTVRENTVTQSARPKLIQADIQLEFYLEDYRARGGERAETHKLLAKLFEETIRDR